MPRPPASPSPPPASFPFTAGSFDYPHASSSPPPPARSSNRNVLRLADEPPERATSDLQHVAPTAAALRRLSTRRRQLHRLLGPPRDSDLADNLLRRPPTANPNRSRATPSERYQTGMGAWRSAFAYSPTEPFDSLSEFPVPAMLHAATRPRSPVGDSNTERRQTKRRKLDHDSRKGSEYDSIRYGYKGQIVPGRLKMDILSCDGGEYQKDNQSGLYNVHNVLKNDKSVYCSESSRCNLLLKHMGDAPFALEKIVIRAPDRGFTAPVQEGLVFVSMTADELLAGTAAYQLQYCSYSPGMSPLSSTSDYDEQLSLREALEDPDVWQTSRRTESDDVEARIERLRIRTRLLNAESNLRAELDRRRSDFLPADADDDVFGDNCDYIADGSYSAAAGVSAPTPPPFTVTTASEDEESDSNEELPSAAIIADRLRRESRWRPNSDDDEDEPRFGPLRRAPPLEYTSYREWRRRQDRHAEPIRASRLGGPSRIEPSDTAAASETLIQPHARFFIAKNKNKITIKFHPAISGRNVLLKFWSPTHDGNIDIESVQLYGYSGPRFFPAMRPC